MEGKTNIPIIVHTNLGTIEEKIKTIEAKIEEARSMIKELASEEILVELEVKS